MPRLHLLERLRRRGRCRRDREPRSRRRDRAARRGSERVDAGLPQRERLVDVGDAEPVGAAVERGAGRLHRAVAVAVRLDDDHHMRRRRSRLDRVCTFRLIAPRSMPPRASASLRAGECRVASLRDHVGDRDAGVVRHREVDARDAPGLGDAARWSPAARSRRVAERVGHDAHVVPVHARRVAERLDERLLRGEPAGERAQRQRLAVLRPARRR